MQNPFCPHLPNCIPAHTLDLRLSSPRFQDELSLSLHLPPVPVMRSSLRHSHSSVSPIGPSVDRIFGLESKISKLLAGAACSCIAIAAGTARVERERERERERGRKTEKEREGELKRRSVVYVVTEATESSP